LKYYPDHDKHQYLGQILHSERYEHGDRCRQWRRSLDTSGESHALHTDQVKARLMKTAYQEPAAAHGRSQTLTNNYYVQSDVFTVGAGYLDLQAALMNV
jgi:hypothetical protein